MDRRTSRISLTTELRFYGLFAVLAAIYAYFTYRRLWLADYWVHSAIIRELAISLFHPASPLIHGGASDIPYWPYLVLPALAHRLTGVAPYVVLAVMGFLNLVLLLYSIRTFVGRLSDAKTAAFYSVAFVLLLWGPTPWLFSGFVHIDGLYYVLAYPSTFCIGVTFLCLSFAIDHLDRPSLPRFARVAFLCILVALIHSLTAIFLIIGLGAVTFWKCGFARPARYAEMSAIVGAAILLAGVWPFFPLFGVIGSSKYTADADTVVLYMMVRERTWPIAFALPFLLARLRKSWRDPLLTTFLGVSAVYLYGGATESWTYGRVLPYAAMTAQIALGIGVAELARWVHKSGTRLWKTSVLVGGLVACAAYGLVVWKFVDACTQYGNPQNIYYFAQAGRTNVVDKFAVLESKIPPSAVVMADFETSLVLPAFGMKVVALPRAAFFAGDYAERRQAVETFFSPFATPEQRRWITAQYGVNYVLLDNESLVKQIAPRDVAAMGGALIHSAGSVVVFEIMPPAAQATPH